MEVKQNSWCVPFAIGMVTGKTPNEIADLIKEERGGNRPVRGVCLLHYLPVLKRLMRITAVVRRPGRTIRKWAANRVKWGDKSTWLIMNAGHMMVYRDGVIYDNHVKGGAPFAEHKFASARLRDAWQVAPL